MQIQSEKFLFIVDILERGMRLDKFINSKLPDKTRSFITNLIDNNCVKLNGESVKCGYSIKVGDRVEVEILPPKEIDLTPSDEILDIVYEDDDLAVVNKRQGMVVHPAVGSYDNTLVNALLSNLSSLSSINGVARPGIVHRLDKNTSGLLVVAKTDFAHVDLQKQISQKSAKRIYIALVNGRVKEDAGKIDKPIGRSKKDRKKMAIAYDGKDAVTLYKVLERFEKFSLVEFELKTGRTHQIRVHSKDLGHIIVGDFDYGDKNIFNLNGQLLHAFKLEFKHPKTGELLTFIAPLPEYFEEILTKLRGTL